jgi:hypothetical protein
MRQNDYKDHNQLDLDELFDEITTDAYTDYEKYTAFEQAFIDQIALPVDGFVIGEPVSVTGFDFDGNLHRGLTAKCIRRNGSVYSVAAFDVVLPSGSKGEKYIAVYRMWLGLEPFNT